MKRDFKAIDRLVGRYLYYRWPSMHVKSLFSNQFDEDLFGKIVVLCSQPKYNIDKTLLHEVLYCLMISCKEKVKTLEINNEKENSEKKKTRLTLKDSLEIGQMLRHKGVTDIDKITITPIKGSAIKIESPYFKEGVLNGLKEHLTSYLKPEGLDHEDFSEIMDTKKGFEDVVRSHIEESTEKKSIGSHQYQNYLHFFTSVLWNFLKCETQLEFATSGNGDVLQKDFIIELYKMIDLMVYGKDDSVKNSEKNKLVLIHIQEKDQQSLRDIINSWVKRGNSIIEMEESNYKDYFDDHGLARP